MNGVDMTAASVRGLKDKVATAATERFLERNPEWLTRYGDRARRFGVEDATFHLEFLAAALDAGDDSLFARYVTWTAGLLDARGIAPEALAENLRDIDELLEGELAASEWERASRILRAGAGSCRAPAAPEGIDRGALSPHASVFLDALLRGDRALAYSLAMKLGRGAVPIASIYLDVFQSSLYRIGSLWAENRITVAEEHRATAIVQFVIAHMYPLLERPAARRGRAVITGVQNELHQVGANMVADMLETDGWDVQFLGTNMPHEGILRAIREHQTKLVGISATMLFNVQHVARLIGDIRLEFGAAGPRVIVGGAAFRTAPELYRQVGADLFAPDLAAAVEAVRS